MALVPRVRRLEVRLDPGAPAGGRPWPAPAQLVGLVSGITRDAAASPVPLRCVDAADGNVVVETTDVAGVEFVDALAPGDEVTVSLGSDDRLWTVDARITAQPGATTTVVALCDQAPFLVEQRAFPRAAIDVRTHLVRLVEGHPVLAAWTHDLSVGGMALVRDPGLRVGEPVVAIIDLPHPTLAAATVLQVRPRAPGARLMFTRLSGSGQARIALAVSQRQALRPSRPHAPRRARPATAAAPAPVGASDRLVTVVSASPAATHHALARRLTLGGAQLELAEPVALHPRDELAVHIGDAPRPLVLLARVVQASAQMLVDVAFVNMADDDRGALARQLAPR